MDDGITMNVSKEKEMEKTEKIIPQNAKYSYEDLELEVEKVVKTPFESFMIIKARENNVLRENFEVNRDEAVRFLSIELRDENDQIIKSQMKSTSKVILPDGGIFNENDDILSEDFESATIESYIVIAAGENLDKVDNVTLKPYYWKFIDNGKYEQEYLNSLEWHEIKDGEYTAKNTKGAELTINKVEVKNDRILFYYKKTI